MNCTKNNQYIEEIAQNKTMETKRVERRTQRNDRTRDSE